MQWVLENWVLVIFGGGMVAMHLFGHRGHGAKGQGGGCCGGAAKKEQPAADDPQEPAAGP